MALLLVPLPADAFAFFLCVIQGAGPGFDLTIARDRTIGILLGNVVVYLIFTRVWPVSIVPRVDRAVAALREQWRVVAAADATRHAVAAEALAAGREAERQLALAAFEPTWLRPSRAWREARKRPCPRSRPPACPWSWPPAARPATPRCWRGSNTPGRRIRLSRRRPRSRRAMPRCGPCWH
ncbi:hypothetical protein WJ966_22310 [Achromobacter xylosoxidans]